MRNYFFIGLMPLIVFIIFLPKILPAKIRGNPDKTVVKVDNIIETPFKTNEVTLISDTILNKRLEAPIFLYHHIRPIEKNFGEPEIALTVTPNIFERQLEYFIKTGFNSINLKDLHDYFYDNKKLPVQPFILTFDDGYKDFYQYVFPFLKKYNIKATIFIITDFVGKPDYLDWQEINELAQSNLVELGAHTLDHKALESVNFYRLSQEIFGSKTELEKRTGRKVDFFCYPYGQYNKQVLDLVKEAKYLGAVTTSGGVWQEADKIFELKRLRLSNGDTEENLGYKLRGLLSSKYFYGKK